MTIPTQTKLYEPIMQFLKDSNTYQIKDIYLHISQKFKLTAEELEERVNSGGLRYQVYCGYALKSLKTVGLVENISTGKYKISKQGLVALENNEVIDSKYVSNLEKSKAIDENNEFPSYENLRERILQESDTDECNQYEQKSKQLVKEFFDEYNIDNLKKLSGKELVEKMFLPKNPLKNSLTYELEFGKVENILGIGGGSVCKFPIYKKKGDVNWYTGPATKQKFLSDEEAVVIAKEELKGLITSINIINEISQKNGFDSIEGYKELNEKLHKIPKPAAWFLKYIILDFIEIFPIFVQDKMLKNLISIFNLEFHGNDNKYLNLGEINLFRKRLGISNYKFGFIVGDMLKKLDNNQKNGVKYWVYSPGEKAQIWDKCLENGCMYLGWDEIGDLSVYDNKNDMKKQLELKCDSKKSQNKNAHQLWNFTHKMNIGDVIFVRKGRSKIIGRGIVKSDYSYNLETGIITHSDGHYNNIRKVKWTHKGEWDYRSSDNDKMTAEFSLIELTANSDKVKYLNSLFDNYEDDNVSISKNNNQNYEESDFLKEVYISKTDYNTLKNLLETKKNIILQGAPGTGKTFAAKKLAYSIIGSKDDERVKLIQFHQSYSYEDFIMGYRPTENGFKLETGVFYDFCNKAKDDPNNDYFFIIDEINRGNLSRIFGELFMLIESDKRGQEYKVNLLYDKNKEFYVPNNLYIIGLMNTADRSLAFLDYALRRRFAFFDMMPGFDNENFKKDLEKLKNDKFKNLIDCIKNLNEEIKNDESLGVGFQIGHSFFCFKNDDKLDESLKRLDESLKRIVMYEILPLLREYWFDEADKIKKWSDNLENCIKDN